MKTIPGIKLKKMSKTDNTYGNETDKLATNKKRSG
jgi:hypothetical protein